MVDLHANVPSGSVQFNSQVSMLARVDAGIHAHHKYYYWFLLFPDIIAEALSILGRVQPQVIRGPAPAPGGGWFRQYSSAQWYSSYTHSQYLHIVLEPPRFHIILISKITIIVFRSSKIAMLFKPHSYMSAWWIMNKCRWMLGGFIIDVVSIIIRLSLYFIKNSVNQSLSFRGVPGAHRETEIKIMPTVTVRPVYIININWTSSP